YTLSLPDGGTVQGEAAGRYVQGRLAVARASVGPGPTDFTNGLTIDPNGQSLGTVTVTRTAGLQTAGLSYGQNLSGTNRGIDRVWQVVAAQPPSATQPATVTASWVADDDNGLNLSTPVQLWRAAQATGPWEVQGPAGSAGTRSFSASVAQLGTFTVSNTSAPLPVTLVSFTAERLGNDGLLNWATASELRNDHFEVESSVDGTTFQLLGQVAGAGTSSQGHRYQYTDSNLARYAAGLVYYRLRPVDTDGTSTYSPVCTVAVPLETGLQAQAYPNPSALGTAVTLSMRTGQAGAAVLSFTDVLGREVGQQQATLPIGVTTLLLPATSQLATGVYLLRVQQGSQQQTLKLVRE
ncbi:MAG: T9SS type A sorting domain-containing protein, partial [Hymenobacter sp.]